MANSLIIAEQSEIIRTGLAEIANSLAMFREVRQVTCISALKDAITRYKPRVLIINPSMINQQGLADLKELNGYDLVIVAIVYTLFDDEYMGCFDEVILIGDNRQKIQKRLQNIISKKVEKTSGSKAEETLSLRELDVLKLLVKGMSNKEISDKLFISTHTVISHRKNITQKLNIKSVAGLTVYAILNELISMEDVQ